MIMQPDKTRETSLCKVPVVFNSVNVAMLAGKLTVAEINTKMTLISEGYKAVMAPPVIRMDSTFKLNASPDDALGYCV